MQFIKTEASPLGIQGSNEHTLAENGADLVEVQQLADHHDINTTLEYRNTRKSDQKNAVDVLDDLI